MKVFAAGAFRHAYVAIYYVHYKSKLRGMPPCIYIDAFGESV